MKENAIFRVRDWKGYGVWYKCGTCEPLQSPTGLALEMSGSAELCRERPNRNSRTKYYDSSHADEQDARHPEEPATGLKKNGGLSLQIHFMSGFGLRFVLPCARAASSVNTRQFKPYIFQYCSLSPASCNEV